MIEVNNLSFGYSKKELLFENLSLSLQPGHIYGLLGKNGAGKSTLIKNITGLAFPKSGSCRIDGREAATRNPEFLQDIFLIPEEIFLPPITIKEFIRNTAGFYNDFDVHQFVKYLEEFELTQDARINSLSFGQQKKVMIAFGIATNSKILIMDEPTNGLDIPSKVQFRKIIASVLTEHRCILISTHQVRDLDNLIDTIIMIHDQKVVLNLSLEKIAEKLLFSTGRGVEEIDVLYSENTVHGQQVIMANPAGRNSRIDLELFFNAVISNTAPILYELNTDHYE
jgi:ABC-2 type transport system ATP-binding protein